jgi:Family of unknown function (DUF6064)
MTVPFTDEEFFDVLAAYNEALWPAAAALWLLSLGAVLRLFARGSGTDRELSAVLAAHWAWSAIAYHAAFFTRINPAAWLFAGLFLTQACLFVWFGIVRGQLRFSTGRSGRHAVAALLAGYALAYPMLTLAQGLEYPRLPLFGVPCPTTILTAGLLLAAESPPLNLLVVPVIWSLIAASAAVLFDVRADFMLLPAAVFLVAFAIAHHTVQFHHQKS